MGACEGDELKRGEGGGVMKEIASDAENQGLK